VYRLGPTADRTTFRYRNGAALVGKELTLEAEEIGGERVLKCRFKVTDKPPGRAVDDAKEKSETPGRKTFQDSLSKPTDKA
jgi:hypothetical protein